jgi:hypothetical protein
MHRTSLLAVMRASVLFFRVCYFLVDLHSQHRADVDVSHFISVLPVFLDLSNGVFKIKVEKQ